MNDLHRDALVADAHNALLMLVARRPKESWSAYLRDRPLIHDLDAEVYVPGFEGPAGLPPVTGALVRRGMPEATIRKVLGTDLARVFRSEQHAAMA